MPNYGVVDLGSNTIRLVIFEIKDDHKHAYTHKDFKSLLNDKVMAGLSAHVRDGVFTDAGIKRAVNVLKGHAKRARYFDCKRFDVFATAVLRNCTNSAEAISGIEESVGTPITLLSMRDEAHLGFVGATCDRYIERGTLVDIGGGSTELTRIEDGHDHHNVSVAQGSLSSYASFVRGILPTPEEMVDITQGFSARIAALPNPHAYDTPTFYGIGGSVRATAKMHAQINSLDVRPKTMTTSEIRAILDKCRTDPDSFAHHALKASAERVHTLTPGCLILDALLERFGGTQLELCKYGVREGYLLERMLG
ncbi:MAG: exopolyphosphatase [Gordonibacter sp.]|nr:exopolyphosphatase [Gordonibacter sp.]